jgi:eukaryotic-like serine/threonine-protein kinase
LQNVDLPTIKAVMEINHKEPAKAIDLLDVAVIYGRANTAVLYVRGLAYLQAKQGKDAVKAFESILDQRYVFALDPAMVFAHLGLGRAYAVLRDTAHSRIEYQNFLAAWKDADPDIPLLKQAKQEYARVQ